MISRISKVLTSPGYLSGDKATQGVFETGEFIGAAMDSPDSLHPGTGATWIAIVRTRPLHSGKTMEGKLGISMTVQRHDDYMHVWRYAGYLTGIDDGMGYTHNGEKAVAGLDSILM
ncbi:hypothetical protein BGZ76_004403 [Entomortierella beljakovae]|nr:hypothetical protein BGZ76_004403 [Entomortierella beljakovae]